MEYLKPLVDWLQLHPLWAGVFTFFISLGESLAIVGLIVPGSVTMTAIGSLIGAGIIPAWEIIIWAILGAIAGDGLSYWLGYHYHENIRRCWPFSRYPQILEKGEYFFHKHGGKSVFIGRFVGPVRPVVPVVAGMMNMHPTHFLIANVASAIAWAPSYMLPGILIGAASLELAPEAVGYVIISFIIALVVAWFIAWILKRIIGFFIEKIDIQLDRLWVWMDKHMGFHAITTLLQNPNHHKGHGQLGLITIIIVGLLLSVIIGYQVEYHHGWFFELNNSVYHLFRSSTNPTGRNLMLAITILGDKRVLIVMLLGTMTWLAIKEQYRAAAYYFVSCATTVVIVNLTKWFFHFPRPSGLIAAPASHAFPSGHTAASVIFFGFLAVLITPALPRKYHWLPCTLGIGLAALIGISRLYLGVHWFTDVTAGFCISITILCLFSLAYRRKIITGYIAPSFLITVFSTLILGWIIYYAMYFHTLAHQYTPYWPNQVINTKIWWQQEGKDVPNYRKNRLGKPVQLLNVQWAGSLGEIKKILAENGWETIAESTVISTFRRITSKSRSHLPLIPSVFQDQKPVLIMTKKNEEAQHIMIFRLWDAHIALSDNRTLWLGLVDHHQPWHESDFFKKWKKIPITRSNDVVALNQLEKDLKGLVWKKPQIILSPQLSKILKTKKATILLIQNPNFARTVKQYQETSLFMT